jgi:hypothetical protein
MGEEKDKKDKASEKIQTLREMIYSAEKTLQGAKAMLLQLEGKKKVGRKKKAVDEEDEGRIIEGTFDGQIMIGMDGKQYPVPANYASKSKLIEGDLLKLTITSDGSFIYKQIGPAERKRLIGAVNQDTDGNYFIIADGKPYRVLLASITYFKVEPGDEVTLVVPRDINSDWGSIENVIQKGAISRGEQAGKNESEDKSENESDHESKNVPEGKPEDKKDGDLSVVDEWAPDFEELKKELNKPEE